MNVTQEELDFLRPGPREEVIWDTRYDRIQLSATASAVPAKSTFFQKSIGGSTTLWDTNMTAAGFIEQGNRMFVKALNFRVFPMTLTTNSPVQSVSSPTFAAIINSIATVLNSLVLTPRIMTKTYGSIPATCVPAGGGFSGTISSSESLAGGSGAGFIENGVPHYANAWPVRWPLPALAPFAIDATMDLAISPTITSVTPHKITLECRISGWSVRATL